MTRVDLVGRPMTEKQQRQLMQLYRVALRWSTPSYVSNDRIKCGLLRRGMIKHVGYGAYRPTFAGWLWCLAQEEETR